MSNLRNLFLQLDHRLALAVGWLQRTLGRRGAALLFFGQLDLVVAWSLVDPLSSAPLKAAPTYRVLVAVAPLWAWALLWAAVGVVCLIQAWRRSDRLAFGLAIMLKVAWALAMFAAWPLGAPRGWIGGEVWLTLAAFVAVLAGWPEQSQLDR
jgi:hypothetical protein